MFNNAALSVARFVWPRIKGISENIFHCSYSGVHTAVCKMYFVELCLKWILFLLAELLGDEILKDLSPGDSKSILDEISESLDFIGQEAIGFDTDASLDQLNIGFSKDILRSVSGGSLDDDLLSLPDTPIGSDSDFLEVFADLSAQIEQVVATAYIICI